MLFSSLFVNVKDSMVIYDQHSQGSKELILPFDLLFVQGIELKIAIQGHINT